MAQFSLQNATQFIRLSPPRDHTASLIFLHGLGDTSAGWLEPMQYLASHLPHIEFLLPTANEIPVTLNMGMKMPAWYDIQALSDRADDPCNGIMESQNYLVKLIEEQVASGIPHSRIVLGGFSQGGAVSLYTGYQMETPVAGICALSGYLPDMKNFRVNPATTEVPLIMCHGEQDQVVKYEWALRSKEKLQECSVNNITWKSYADMEHSACLEELNDVKQWLNTTLPPL